MGEYLLGFLLGHWTLVLGRAEQTDVCVLADLRGGGNGEGEGGVNPLGYKSTCMF